MRRNQSYCPRRIGCDLNHFAMAKICIPCVSENKCDVYYSSCILAVAYIPQMSNSNSHLTLFHRKAIINWAK